jgi:hypothetical protein
MLGAEYLPEWQQVILFLLIFGSIIYFIVLSVAFVIKFIFVIVEVIMVFILNF